MKSFVVGFALCAAAMNAAARERIVRDWREPALHRLRIAAAEQVRMTEADLAMYRAAGFNGMVAYDTTGIDASGWKFKTESEIEAETAFAREHGFVLIIGLAVEPFVALPWQEIPGASDEEIRERLRMWDRRGSDIIVGAFPWYDDVFWDNVDVERQRHIYRLIRETVPGWYVFGMIGEFGFNASGEDVTAYYDPTAFDHLILLMYPYNVGSRVTGFPLDHTASEDPDGDIARYVDHFMSGMMERFFLTLRPGQQVLVVGQAFHYAEEPEGAIPRGRDIEIMTSRASDWIRALPGQSENVSAAYCCWGAEASPLIGIAQRADWRTAVRNVHVEIDVRDGH